MLFDFYSLVFRNIKENPLIFSLYLPVRLPTCTFCQKTDSQISKYVTLCVLKALTLFKTLLAGLSLQIPGFDLWPVYVRFVVDRVAVEQDFLEILRSTPVSTIPLVLCFHPFVYHRHCKIITELNITFIYRNWSGVYSSTRLGCVRITERTENMSLCASMSNGKSDSNKSRPFRHKICQ